MSQQQQTEYTEFVPDTNYVQNATEKRFSTLLESSNVPEFLESFATDWYGDKESINVPKHFEYLGSSEFVPIYNEQLHINKQYVIIKAYTENCTDPKYQYKHDPILDPPEQTTIEPIPEEYALLFDSYNKQSALFWKHSQLDFSSDAIVYNTLPSEQQYSINGVLGFFAQADTEVNEIIEHSFLPYIQNPIVKLSYHFKEMMEDTHTLTYQKNLSMLVSDKNERTELLNSIGDDTKFPSIKSKADWAKKWGSTEIPICYRIFAQACTEGIQFSGSFMFLDYLDHAGIKLPGTQAANGMISRDEGFHTYDAGQIYKQLKYVVPVSDAFMIVQECVDTEVQFMRDVIGDRFSGLKMSDIITHIKYTANTVVCNLLGYSEPYPGARCPFEFMQGRDLATVLNFFEVHNSSDYHHADLKITESDFSPASSLKQFTLENPPVVGGFFSL
jgi:ribonucleotide reductase beta subunit family protein with ferritin-like domain